MKIALTGGGTGGHVSPCLAVARAAAAKGHESFYIGTADGIEADMVPRAGLTLRTVPAAKLLRKAAWSNLGIPWALARGFWAARAALKAERPGVLLATGGYVSLPAGLAAASLRIPVVVHESNAAQGLANRLLARLASRVCVSYEPEGGLKPGQALTGNPVRLPLDLPTRGEGCKAFGLDPDRFTLFIFPGSRAAQSVNAAVEAAIPAFESEAGGRLQLLWLAGLRDYTHAVKVAKAAHLGVSVQSFIHDTPSAYACADLVLARAGASTLAELACLGMPSILVPYPHATGNHQEANARRFEAVGASRVIDDAALDGRTLAKAVLQLMDDERGLRGMAAAAKVLGRRDAAERVLRACEEVAR